MLPCSAVSVGFRCKENTEEYKERAECHERQMNQSEDCSFSPTSLFDCSLHVSGIVVYNDCFHCVAFSSHCLSAPQFQTLPLQKLNVEEFKVRIWKKPVRCMGYYKLLETGIGIGCYGDKFCMPTLRIMLSFETILEQAFELKRDKKQNNNNKKN